MNYDFQASEWFWSKLHKDENPKSINKFESKFPPGSEDFQLFERFTSKFELAGLLSEYRFLIKIYILIDMAVYRKNGKKLNL